MFPMLSFLVLFMFGTAFYPPSGDAIIGSIQDLNGTWVGTFNGQPHDGVNETVTYFQLRLRQKGKTLSGSLFVTPHPKSAIRRGSCDKMGCSFEVTDYGDGRTPQAWRISVDAKGELEGTRNRGPMNSYGFGAGARFFSIQASRRNDQ